MNRRVLSSAFRERMTERQRGRQRQREQEIERRTYRETEPNLYLNTVICLHTLVPEVFFRREENIKRQTKKRFSHVFSIFSLSLHHFALRLSPFHGSSLRKPLASRVMSSYRILIIMFNNYARSEVQVKFPYKISL